MGGWGWGRIAARDRGTLKCKECGKMNGGSRGWKGGGRGACTQLDQRGGQKPDNHRVSLGQRKDDRSEGGFCSRNFRKPLGGLGGGPVEEDNRTGTQGSQGSSR